MEKFQVGDKIVCLSSSSWMGGYEKNKIYTYLEDSPNGCYTVEFPYISISSDRIRKATKLEKALK